MPCPILPTKVVFLGNSYEIPQTLPQNRYLTSDIEPQELMSRTNGLFNLSGSVAASKNKPQVAGTLRKRDQSMIELSSNFNSCNMRYAARILYTMHRF